MSRRDSLDLRVLARCWRPPARAFLSHEGGSARRSHTSSW